MSTRSYWILENTVLPLMMPESQCYKEPMKLDPMKDWEHEPMTGWQPAKICPHPPGTYCYFCYCANCMMFFSTKRRKPRKPEIPRPPSWGRYSYMGLVNSLRAAAAKREEDRQEKLQAERDAAAGVKSPKKEKDTKSPKKKGLRQSTKRRRV